MLARVKPCLHERSNIKLQAVLCIAMLVCGCLLFTSKLHASDFSTTASVSHNKANISDYEHQPHQLQDDTTKPSEPSLNPSWQVWVSTTAQFIDALASAPDYSEIHLNKGLYLGQFTISRPLTLIGHLAEVDAQGSGSAITVAASKVSISGLSIRNWGNDLYTKNAGILVREGSDNLKVFDNQLSGPGFGVYAEKVAKIRVCHNRIEGDDSAFMLDRGDGVHLLRATDPKVQHNHITHVRDGVYLESGTGSLVNHNYFAALQYGVHYMYTQDDVGRDNTAKDVVGGYALMSSKQIKLHHNKVSRASEFGVLLNMTNDAYIEYNSIAQIMPKDPSDDDLFSQGKGMFIYASQNNHIKANKIADSQVGIALALGGESNKVYLNQFLHNQTQVRYIGESRVEWSEDHQGNYWSDYRGLDLNGDGIGDTAHVPNDKLDRLFWLYPEAQFLMGSPVVQVLKWLDSQFQNLDNNGVVDRYPLLNAGLQ
ncbi:nitrous oxide reductase family maturation protein NosD [Shewanella sp. WXL01]|uniref:nitrous oxide reductase family maturation protein NosD n=1 Tax=Shewanella sp. WXL01 TaxID=2709721 RepID=UPI0014383DD2|nr:nitrous oxide reductase family maturation protein NosD [Shewanella sp. WXL01]NKF51928.1 nitrous oxide reductase family maturation protein NosD [Shewanella sp. WXL01]